MLRFKMDDTALGQVSCKVLLDLHCSLSFPDDFILICYHVKALTRQHIITFLVLKMEAASVTQHLAHHRVRNLNV